MKPICLCSYTRRSNISQGNLSSHGSLSSTSRSDLLKLPTVSIIPFPSFIPQPYFIMPGFPAKCSLVHSLTKRATRESSVPRSIFTGFKNNRDNRTKKAATTTLAISSRCLIGSSIFWDFESELSWPGRSSRGTKTGNKCENMLFLFYDVTYPCLTAPLELWEVR